MVTHQGPPLAQGAREEHTAFLASGLGWLGWLAGGDGFLLEGGSALLQLATLFTSHRLVPREASPEEA